MNASELAQKMLEWEQLIDHVKLLEAEIKTAVLSMGKTQTVGNVRASYSGGRRTFDYETPGRAAPEPFIVEFTEMKFITDWKSVCEKAGIEPVVLSQSEPTVSLKLMV